MLSSLITTLLVINALVLIVLIIVLQRGPEGGIGSALGSGNSSGIFGASGGVNIIVKLTWIFGLSFIVLAAASTWVKTRDRFAVGRELDSLESHQPAETPTPNLSSSPTPKNNDQKPAVPEAPADKK